MTKTITIREVLENAEPISTRKTQRQYYSEIRAILVDGGYPDELIEFIDGRVAQLDKKNSAERKPTARQTENDGFKSDIVAWMEQGQSYLLADIVKGVPSLVAAGVSPNRTTAMMTQLVNAGVVLRTTDKRKSVYTLA